MNSQVPLSTDDRFAALLGGFDDALALGATPPRSPLDEAGAELADRLARGTRCVELLAQLRPRRRELAMLETPRGDDTAAVSTHAPPGELPRALGRFEIRRELGRGGFGIVYLAHDPRLKRDVALKVPRFAALADPDLKQRFAREAQAGAGLDHPNVAAVYDAGEVAGVSYIASAYCPGITLAQWLRQQDLPLAFSQAAALLACLADAVGHGHSRGILHRDLKPGNVMLVEAAQADQPDAASAAPAHSCRLGEKWYCPKITDFGLARRIDEAGQTREGAALGTPSYMAPEQTRSGAEQCTAATDVYGLGAILYELLAGRAPFIGESPLEVLDHVRSQEVVSPRRLRPRLPRDLETICVKCLAKQSRQRYATAAALAEDLRRFLAHVPIRARPVGRLERAWRWCQKRPLVAGLSALLLAAVSVGIGGTLWQWRVATAALHDKELAAQAEGMHRQYAGALDAARLVAVAHREWLADRQDEARRLLELCPPQHRNEAWRHLHALSHAQIGTVRVNGGPTQLVFSTTGKYFAIAHILNPSALSIYYTDSLQERFRLPREGLIECAAFSSDDKTLAVVYAGSTTQRGERKLVVWELATGTKRREEILERESLGRSGFLLSVISNGGQSLAWISPGLAGPSETLRPGRTLVIWDPGLRQVRHTLRAPETGFYYALAITPDGRRLAVAHPPSAVLVVDPATGAEVASLRSRIQADSMVAISDDGQLLACSVGSAVEADGVKIWDVAAGTELAHFDLAHRALRMDLSCDGRFLAAAGADTGVQLFSIEAKRHVAALRGHRATPVSVAFSPDSHLLVSTDGAGSVLLWDIRPWTTAGNVASGAK